jgi:hypothetical protein
MKRLIIALFLTGLLCGLTAAAQADLLHQATLKNGDYGDGAAIPTMTPERGDSPDVLGITNSSEGVTFTATETRIPLKGLSNALINWVHSNQTQRMALKNHGTISFRVKFDRQNHVSGWIIGENYGYNKFNHGQGSFGAYATRMDEVLVGERNDDKVRLHWNVWFESYPGNWLTVTDLSNRLPYDRWHDVGFAWGGPDHDFEIWANHKLISAYDLPAGASLPWGQEYIWAQSGINLGLGTNHERGYGWNDTYARYTGNYTTSPGVSFSDINIWNEYRPFGDTVATAVLPPYLLLLDK